MIMHNTYKKSNMNTWNELAPRYHKRWASKMHGPLQSTQKLLQDLKVHKDDTILDVACGTGMVTKMLNHTTSNNGLVVGADMSISAIKIAQKENAHNILFVNADAENMAFATKFDVITCQYGLFFFPNATRALKNMRRNLKKTGKIGIVVHGSRDRAPFYGSILDAAEKFIKDYIPKDTPQLDRYSTKKELKKVVYNAGFTNVAIKDYTFEYSPGTFESYWRDYQRYVSKPLKEKIDALGRTKKKKFREEIKCNTKPYTDENGIITFPWQVLVLVAMR